MRSIFLQGRQSCERNDRAVGAAAIEMLHLLLWYALILSGPSTLRVLAQARWASACEKVHFAA